MSLQSQEQQVDSLRPDRSTALISINGNTCVNPTMPDQVAAVRKGCCFSYCFCFKIISTDQLQH